MLRGLLGPMEKHHKVRISDEAVVAAVDAVGALHPGAPAARQGGQPARHRLRARRDQPEHDAGRDRGPEGRDQRAQQGARRDRARRATSAAATEAQGRARGRGRRHPGEAGDAWRPTMPTRSRSSRDRRLRAKLAATAQRQTRQPLLQRRAPAGGAAADAAERRCSAAGDRPTPRTAPASCKADRARPKLEERVARHAHDLSLRRRAGGGLGRLRLDRHPGRPHGQGRDRRPCCSCRKS